MHAADLDAPRTPSPLLAARGVQVEDVTEMHISCPSCAAAYEVPDRLLAGPARMLRCSRCGADFPLPQAEAPVPEPPPVLTTVPPPEPERAIEPPRAAASAPVVPRREPPALPAVVVPKASSPALVGAWVASIALLGAAIASLLVFHVEVMAAWPASARLFVALGLA